MEYDLIFHTSSGTKFIGEFQAEIESGLSEDSDPDEVAEWLMQQLSEPERPCWMALGNVAFFSGAITAVEVSQLIPVSETDGESEET